MEPKKKIVPFSAVISALRDETQDFPYGYLNRFSDISRQDLETLKKAWLDIPADRRSALMEDLEELAEEDTLVSFDDLSLFALTDPDPRVRAAAIRLLWELQHLKLVPIFINLLENDTDAAVRAEAALGLGSFIYLGELEEISSDTLHHVEERLLAAAAGDPEPRVRQNAVQALGFSSRDEVPALIQAAYENPHPQWIMASLLAMGRSADPRWENNVLRMLSNPDALIQAEAVRAAGNLELASARHILIDMIQENEDLLAELFEAAVWSLSQIGGEMVRPLLISLQDAAEDPEDLELLEAALENLDFTENFELFDLFDLEGNEEEADENDTANPDPS